MANDKEITFTVKDMMCSSCEKTIKTVLSNMEGISNIETNVDQKEVKVAYDENKADVEEMISGLDNVGFPADIKKKL